MGYKPEGPNEYQGKQVIINSDRLLFNAKEDSIFLFSDKSISFSTNGTINFDIITDDKEHKGVFNIPYLYFSIDKGETWINIGKDLPNTGTYSWQVPSIKQSSNKCKIGEKKFFGPLEIKALKCQLSKNNDSTDVVAYLQVKDLSTQNNNQVFLFNGWTFASSPTLQSIYHPIYDLWIVGCENI